MLNGGVHIACGRRCFNENAVDFLLTLHVNAGNSPRIRDGVDGPIAWPSKFFPTWLRQIARRLPHHDCRSTKGGAGPVYTTSRSCRFYETFANSRKLAIFQFVSSSIFSDLRLAFGLLYHCSAAGLDRGFKKESVTLRVEKSAKGEVVAFALSGQIRTEEVAELHSRGARQDVSEFANHVRGARTDGLQRTNCVQVLIQITIYCGIPVGADCFQVAETILNEDKGK